MAGALQYAADFVNWVSALKQIDPSSKFGAVGPSNRNGVGEVDCCGTRWWETVLPVVAATADFLICHSYPINAWSFSTYYQNTQNFQVAIPPHLLQVRFADMPPLVFTSLTRALFGVHMSLGMAFSLGSSLGQQSGSCRNEISHKECQAVVEMKSDQDCQAGVGMRCQVKMPIRCCNEISNLSMHSSCWNGIQDQGCLAVVGMRSRMKRAQEGFGVFAE